MVCRAVLAQDKTYQVMDSRKINLIVCTHFLETKVLAHCVFVERKSFPTT